MSKEQKQFAHLVGKTVIVKRIDGTEVRGILQKSTQEGIYILPVSGGSGSTDIAHADHGDSRQLDAAPVFFGCCFIPLAFLAAVCFFPRHCHPHHFNHHRHFCHPRPFCGPGEEEFF